MKILVTGATGFVGRRLVEHLAERGGVVTALSRDPERAMRTLPKLSKAYRWDPRSHPPAEAFDGVDAIVHLAGESVAGRWTAHKRAEIRRSRVEGTRLLVEALREALGAGASWAPVVVSASAIGYYGDRGDETLSEDAAPGDDFLAGVCREWEREALRAGELGVRVALLRTGIVLGHGGAARPLLTLTRFGLGGPLGSGRQWWSWIYIDDLVRLIEHVIHGAPARDVGSETGMPGGRGGGQEAGQETGQRFGKRLEGPINATAPEPVRQREFARLLGRVLRRPAVVSAPAFALKLVLGGFAGELLGSRRVLPVKAVESGFTFECSRLDDALERLVAAGAGET